MSFHHAPPLHPGMNHHFLSVKQHVVYHPSPTRSRASSIDSSPRVLRLIPATAVAPHHEVHYQHLQAPIHRQRAVSDAENSRRLINCTNYADMRYIQPAKVTHRSIPQLPVDESLVRSRSPSVTEVNARAIQWHELALDEEPLGEGGCAQLSSGWFEGRHVAIKQFANTERAIKDFYIEARVLSELDHEHVVKLLAVCYEPYALVLELVDGVDLHKFLAADPIWTLRRQLRVALDVADAVSYVHSKGFVYRDLKSANILLDQNHRAILIDFGFAVRLNDQGHVCKTTHGNSGTMRYMPPECWVRERLVTQAMDVWAMGCLLIELFGGGHPYLDVEDPMDLRNKMFAGMQPGRYDHVHPVLQRLIHACLQHDPLERPSMRDVGEVLKTFLDQMADD